MNKKDNNTARLYDFLKEVGENNNREWFHEHKDEHDELRRLWLLDIQLLINRMAEYDDTLQGLEAKDCAYRIYRDIRFSPNKLPYKTYFSAVIAHGGRKSPRSCYYIHMQPGDSGLHGGIWCPEAPLLRRLRSEIDGNIEEFLSIVNNEDFKSRYEFVGETLKLMPKGYPKDHPYPQYMKMKEYLVSHHVDDRYFTAGDWVEEAAQDFKHMKPLHDFLNYVFEDK